MLPLGMRNGPFHLHCLNGLPPFFPQACSAYVYCYGMCCCLIYTYANTGPAVFIVYLTYGKLKVKAHCSFDGVRRLFQKKWLLRSKREKSTHTHERTYACTHVGTHTHAHRHTGCTLFSIQLAWGRDMKCNLYVENWPLSLWGLQHRSAVTLRWHWPSLLLAPQGHGRRNLVQMNTVGLL